MLADWIVVVDDDPVSARQLAACRAERPQLQGAVDCSDADNHAAEVCQKVTHFPAFCHAPSNTCVYGLRTTADEFRGLQALAPPEATTEGTGATTADATRART